MTHTPGIDSVEKRLSALEAAIAEYDRKTLSNLAVTDPGTGIKMLVVDTDPSNGKSRLTVKDSTGNILLLNDTGGSGWGLRAPQYSGGHYTNASFSTNQTTTVTDKLNFEIVYAITAQRARVRYYTEASFTGTKTGTYSIKWAPWGTTSYTDIVPAFTITGTGYINNTPTFVDAMYSWPSNMFGQVVQISAWSHLSVAGSGDWTSMTMEFAQNIPA